MAMATLNMKEYDNKELLLFPPSIGDYLPENDLAHVIDEAVDAINMKPYYDKIPATGNPSYNPRLMIKVWFYGYATKTYSSRKIEEKLQRDVAFIYLAGMQKPDFKTIAEFRRKHLSELKDTFTDILQICRRLGLTQLGEVSIDSKVMKASASADKTYDEERLVKEREEIERRIEEYLREVNQTDDSEDWRYGTDKRGNELPGDITEKQARIEKMRRIAKKLQDAQKKLSKSERKKINLTDNDARFQKGTGKVIPGYRAHIAVDGENQVIIANDVTNYENDTCQLLPMVDKTLENEEKLKSDGGNNEVEREKAQIKITADGGYSSGKNLSKLEEDRYKKKIDAYIPDTNSSNRERGKGCDKESPFHRSKFIYNERENSFICPEGKKLKYLGKHDSHGVLCDVYENYTDCKECRHYGICTTSKTGRRISIMECQPLIDKMREKLNTKEGRKIYGKRKIIVEPVFGNMSHNLGFREFLLRGEDKVNGEFALMCIAHNIKKITKSIQQIGISLKNRLRQPELLCLNDTS